MCVHAHTATEHVTSTTPTLCSPLTQRRPPCPPKTLNPNPPHPCPPNTAACATPLPSLHSGIPRVEYAHHTPPIEEHHIDASDESQRVLVSGSGVGWGGWRVRRGCGGKSARKRGGGGGGGAGAGGGRGGDPRRGSGTRDFTTARPTNTVTNTVLSSNDAMGTKAGSPASPEPTFWQFYSTVCLVTRPVLGPSRKSWTVSLITNKLQLHRNLNPHKKYKCDCTENAVSPLLLRARAQLGWIPNV